MFDLIVPAMNKESIMELIDYYNDISLIRKIVLVDFSPGFTRSMLAGRAQKLHHIKLKNQNEFNKSAALNLGIYHSSSDYLICCDADVLISKSTINEWKKLLFISKEQLLIYLENVKERDSGLARPAWGVVCGSRSIFLDIDGFDSMYEGWGFEDLDIIYRIKQLNVTIRGHGIGEHISHNNIVRLMNYKNKSLSSSREINLQRYFKKTIEDDLSGTIHIDLEHYKEYLEY